ncbi:5599_t:CDS:2 [Funneliformis geosporum]|uniref:2808_t:CDS:1 n=1 Tax=Funneliformis geosporum TaxID=1117311 RepID=A0A9W4SN19_9GLOM|nr:5599_t:CDS:2 [Funneliformis geosporum]CAI2175101.1 2808_t:CDS:2 [Funneliformis geosporum]
MAFFYTLSTRLPTYEMGDYSPHVISNNVDYNPSSQEIKKFLDVEVYENIIVNVEPEEKFLAYFTHSGYHNQRIALENALLLSKLLNRTLLIPPVLLGPPIPWVRFDKMYERLFLSTKNGLDHCIDIPNEYPLPAECLDYYTYTSVSWDFLLDMKPIRKWNKLIDRIDHSFEWLESNLVIHLGSLFGSYRVIPELPTNKEHLKFIKQHLVPHNSFIQKAAERVVEQLGGEKNFIGLHIRVSDGFFMKTARQNIDLMYHTIINNYTNLTPEEIDKLEGGTHYQDILEDDSVDLGDENPYNKMAKITKKDENQMAGTGSLNSKRAYIPELSNKINCKSSLHPLDQGVNTVIFIATDAASPRTNPLLFKFFNTFPCVFVLDDFGQDLIDIKYVRNAQDKTPLAKYLIPMLDAMISAKGFQFMGTPKSTFSNYINTTLHPIYTGKELTIKITTN